MIFALALDTDDVIGFNLVHIYLSTDYFGTRQIIFSNNQNAI